MSNTIRRIALAGFAAGAFGALALAAPASAAESAFVSLSGSEMSYIGTSGSDSLTIERQADGRVAFIQNGIRADENVCDVEGNRAVCGVWPAAVPVRIDGFGGDDVVRWKTPLKGTINGGNGNDRFIHAIPAGVGGVDELTFNGDAGVRDSVSYAPAGAAVNLSLDGTRNDGRVGTGDKNDVTGSVEDLYGSAFADTLTGNNSSNILGGRAGDDKLFGLDAFDHLDGGTGTDTLDCGKFNNDYAIGDALDTFKNCEQIDRI